MLARIAPPPCPPGAPGGLGIKLCSRPGFDALAGPEARPGYLESENRPRIPAPIRHSGQGEAFLYSLVVPGLSQYRLGTRRWIAYAGLEAVSALLYFRFRADARRSRAAYRDFAWERARLGMSPGPRRDGDFFYYEVLSKWDASGAWDSDSSLQGLQPETDPSTYNGSVWALAVEIFSLDPSVPERSPGYVRALDYYRTRGYGAPFLWAWMGKGARTRYGELISESDHRSRSIRRALWVLVANHMVSAIDGLIMVRLGTQPHTDRTELVFSVGTS